MIFLRHPVTSAKPGLCYGRMDIGLGDQAPDQIQAALLSCPRAETIVSSPAKRCRALTEALARSTGASVSYDDRLWEMNFGRWEGLFWSQIPRSQSDPWADDIWSTAPPEGETFGDVCARVGAALSGLSPETVIVAHGGVIRAAWIVLQGVPVKTVWDRQVPFATPVRIDRKAN